MRRLLFSAVLALAPAAAFAAPSRVVADIAPVHSLVALVMGEVASPDLLLPPGADPHHFQLRPSQARTLRNADLVIWMGEALTPWLGRVIDTSGAAHLELLRLDPLPLRIEGRIGTFNELSDARPAAPEDHAEHDHGDLDPHAWLDPINAAAFLHAIAARLANLDPDNGDHYRRNAETHAVRLRELTGTLSRDLRPGRDILLTPAHDAYAYFFQRFDLRTSGGLSSTDAAPPGAARLDEIRVLLARAPRACLFVEPGSPTALVQAVAPSPDTPVLTFDPLGATLTPGPDLYGQVIRGLAGAIAECIARTGAE